MSDNFQFTAEYNSLIDALRNEVILLRKLNSEMIAYGQNKNDSESKKTLDFHSNFYIRLTGASTKIILLSASVVEASINLHLAMEIKNIEDYELFNDLERIDLIKKWVVLPRLFNSDYSFDKSGQLYQILLDLKKKRDAFVHYKPTLKVNDKTVLKGSPHPHPGKNIGEQINTLLEYANLPNRLVEHLLKSGCNSSTMIFLQYSLSKVIAETK